ncbi:MAG: YjbH domain-containing protein [Firmicutes bacterium]|nr:YjbH domain-containing protein [Bacillota bacterium]
MAKKRFLTLMMIGLLLIPTRAAFGYGVFGSSDLMITPSTATLNANDTGFALNFAEGDVTLFNLDYGLISDLEIGLSVLNYDDDRPWSDGGETYVTLRGKYRLLRETSSAPALAIGIQDIGEEDLDVSPYLVISKNLGPDLDVDGYLGVGGGAIDGIFGGLSKIFRISPAQRGSNNLSRIQLILEFDSDNMNLATRFQIGPRMKINFGFYDMENWMVGMTYTI